MLLTAAERVLLHLLPLWNAKDVAREATQEGIAEGTGLRRSHVPRAVKRLVADASVDVREGRIRGRGRKVRVYVLTEPGIRRARELLTGLESEEVLFGDVWERPQLSKRDRSLITCAALIATGKTELRWTPSFGPSAGWRKVEPARV